MPASAARGRSVQRAKRTTAAIANASSAKGGSRVQPSAAPARSAPPARAASATATASLNSVPSQAPQVAPAKPRSGVSASARKFNGSNRQRTLNREGSWPNVRSASAAPEIITAASASRLAWKRHASSNAAAKAAKKQNCRTASGNGTS